MHLFSELWHEIHRPFAGTGLAIILLGTLDLVYALAPPWSTRYKILKALFWALYPVLILVLFTGRKMRQDKELHKLYARCIVVLGLVITAWALL